MHVHLTWYLLVDGTHADPNDVSRDKDGALRHKSGMAVALHADGTPQSIGRDAVDNKNVEAAKVGESDAPADVKPLSVADLKAKAGPEPATVEAPLVEKVVEPDSDPTPPKTDRQMKPAKNKARYKTR